MLKVAYLEYVSVAWLKPDYYRANNGIGNTAAHQITLGITPRHYETDTTNPIALPMVFVKGTLVGGAQDVERLIASGELKRLLA